MVRAGCWKLEAGYWQIVNQGYLFLHA